MNSMIEFERLMSDLRVLDSFSIKDYTFLKWEEIEGTTQKAVKIDGKWYPKSGLAIDPDEELYVANWVS